MNSNSRYYILDGHTVIPTDDTVTWAQFFEKADRIVKKEVMQGQWEGAAVSVEISTVFLGLNHQFDDGPPLIFETMVFGGPDDGDMDRCSTWEQAIEQHERMADTVRKKIGILQ